MKKLLLVLFLIIMPVTSFSASSNYSCAPIDYQVMVNGSAMTFTDAPPMNYSGRTMLPLRAVSEALSVPILWDGKKVVINTVDIEALKKACIMITADDGKTAVQGSGVFIDYDEVLTANHVVKDRPNVKSDGLTLTITETNPSEDAAILHSTESVKPVIIGDSDTLKVGDVIYVISAPNGKEDTVTKGTITSFGITNDRYCFHSKAITSGGSSGGAVFNSNGQLIGIVQSGYLDTSDFIPINDIRKTLAN